MVPCMTGGRQRHAWIDVAKAISIVLVVLVHAIAWLSFADIDPGPVLQRVNDVAGNVRMPLFFTMSGIFAGQWVQRPWRRLINGKLALLAWPFLAWQLAMFAYKYGATFTLPGQENDSFAEHVLRVVVAPVRPNAELWFLWALVLFFVTAKVLRSWPPGVLLASAVALSVAWSSLLQVLPGHEVVRLAGPGLSGVPMYFVFFVAGMVLKDRILAAAGRVAWWQAAIGFAVWAVLFGVFEVLEPVDVVPGVRFVGQVCGVVGGSSLAVTLARVRALRVLGQQTLPVYLSHTTFVVVMASCLHALDAGASSWPGSLVVLSVAVLAILGGLALQRLWGDTVLFHPPSRFAITERSRSDARSTRR